MSQSGSGSHRIECASVISEVVVHARGALVTRDVTLPDDLPSGVIDIDVTGVTIEAQEGSVRAALDHDSERVVATVRAATVYPSGDVRPGPTAAKVRELTAKRDRLHAELRLLGDRRSRLIGLQLEPQLRVLDRRQRQRDVLDVRFAEGLRMAALLKEKIARLDERVLGLEKEHRAVVREIEAARLEDSQASSANREGDARARRTITTRLTGSGKVGRLRVTYAITAARWWPTYTLRIAEAANAEQGEQEREREREATWTFEAIVAQQSGEDWSGVALSLSSADLVFDARLPELASLRFGRAQQPRRRAFRPAPVGVDDMFVAYLAFGVTVFRTTPVVHSHVMDAPAAPTDEGFLDGADGDEDEDTAVLNQGPIVDALMMDVSDMREQQRGMAPPMNAPAPAAPMPLGGLSGAGGGGAVPVAKSMSFAASVAPGGAAMPEMARRLGRARMEKGAPDAYAEYDAEPMEPEVVPSEMWSNHDALILANADLPRRGRLIPRMPGGAGTSNAQALSTINRAASERYIDPLISRGMFDHRYEANGRADVPSDGRVHRVTVGVAPCPLRVAWRTVPSENAEVYREAQVTNPFDTGLLGGPLDVYLDGSLLASTKIDRIDRGGTFYCGMGVDDRIKVARNIRVDEESAGLLGGSIAVTHTVSIEVVSTIREPVKVTVLERIPVTDDKAIEIKIVRGSPLPDAYDQADRNAPIRGGARFEITAAPGKKTPIELVYRLVFPQKLDIVGGSRRG